MIDYVGIVVIGRNEGERLRRCLKSVEGKGWIVYVDSGSRDGSIELARDMGVEVLLLDRSVPFTAGRARNAGFRHLKGQRPDLHFIQFVDGDCEVDGAWIVIASDYLRNNAGVAAVCGRLVERLPDASIYNRLCQLEWDGPTGVVNACGGIAMYAVGPLVQAGLFRESMIAGEEPELCFRIRAAGMQIMRLDARMAWHDASMTHFWQWFRRCRRGGYAFAECFWLHRSERFRARESARILLWGLAVPTLLVLMVILSFWMQWAKIGMEICLALYLISFVRTAWKRAFRGTPASDALLYAAFTTIGKVPEAAGLVQFTMNTVRCQQSSIIEYKS